MNLKGEHQIPADRQSVWKALNDPEILKACLPGCEQLEKISDTEMTATITTKIGPVKATFKGSVKLSELNPPNSYKLEGEGQGGAAGFASGTAEVSLSEASGNTAHTILTYDVDAKVGGKLAQIGSRLIDSVSKKIATQFFETFVAKVAENSTDSFEDTEEKESRLTTAPPIRPKYGIPTHYWVTSIIGGVVLLILWAVGLL